MISLKKASSFDLFDNVDEICNEIESITIDDDDISNNIITLIKSLKSKLIFFDFDNKNCYVNDNTNDDEFFKSIKLVNKFEFFYCQKFHFFDIFNVNLKNIDVF